MRKRTAWVPCMCILLSGCAILNPGSSAMAGAPAAWKPAHDITIRVPKGAGDAMDVITRLVGQSFAKVYGANVLVVNQIGANGAVAAADLKRMDPDPCEMMTAGIVLFTLVPLFSDDIVMDLKDWKFVTGLTSEDLVLVANAKTNLKTLADVVAFAKKNRLLVGTQAAGGANHMMATALFGANDVEWQAVTSNSGNMDILACANGTVQVAFASTSTCSQFIEEGSVVPILTFGTAPYTGFKGFTVTTATAEGFDLVWRTLNYIITRSEVPDAVIDEMYKAVSTYCASEEFIKAAKTANIPPYICDGKECYAIVSKAREMCEAIYKKYYE